MGKAWCWQGSAACCCLPRSHGQPHPSCKLNPAAALGPAWVQEWTAKATDRKEGAIKVYKKAQEVLKAIHNVR